MKTKTDFSGADRKQNFIHKNTPRPYIGGDSYAEFLTASLIKYADENTEFGNNLVYLVRQFYTPESNAPQHGASGFLRPADGERALQRALWLASSLLSREIPGKENAVAMLCSWAKDREFSEPKQIVIGLAIGIIPGITLGRLKKYEQMYFILRQDIALKSDFIKISRTAASSCSGVLAESFARSSGDARWLEPELYDWLFGERALVFFTANMQKIDSIRNELENVGAAFGAVEDDEGLAGLAISPSVNKDYLASEWALDPLQR